MPQTHTKLVVALCSSAMLFPFGPATFAQDAYSIRVESNQVLVPVFVFDSTRVSEPPSLPFTLCPVGNTEMYCNDAEVAGLTAKDFHLFEDGKEQKIQAMRFETLSRIDVRDNLGRHDEESNIPGGKWSTSELPKALSGPLVQDHVYLLAYIPPDSSEGSCHKIKVKVSRHNSYLYTRNQYCNTKQSPSDPINGTKFGKQLESSLSSPQSGKINLSLQVGVFYSKADTARVAIALEFPWNSLARHWSFGTLSATIGILGVVHRKDGTLAARFSDLGCCPSDRPAFYRGEQPNQSHPEADIGAIPSRYETRVDLPPGEYILNVVLSDGSKFGKAEAPLIVSRYDRNRLAMSSIVLCKRFMDAATASQNAAAVNLAPNLVPLVSKGVEFTPAGDTTFREGERLFAYFEVYPPELSRAPAPAVQSRLRVTSVKSGEVKLDTGLRIFSPEPGKDVVSIAEEVGVDKLPPDLYQLEVQASDSIGETTVWRLAHFRVR